MANRIKTVSQYDGSNWVNETPIGADASNIDVVAAGSTSRNLQDVLGTPPASGNITNNINSKVSISGGDVADTIVSKDIANYDSSTEVDDDILTDTAAVMSTNTSTLWSRFNLFRKKVSNNFENYFTNSSLVGADPGVTITGDDSTAYTTAAINNYLSNVIGYTSASAPSAGTVASQLSTLNNKIPTINTAAARAEWYWNRFVTDDGVYSIPHNPHSKLTTTTTTISSTTSTNGTFIAYQDDAETNLIHSYDTGGIYNKIDQDLKVLVIFHLVFQTTATSASAGTWIGIHIKTRPASTSSYSHYYAMGVTGAYASGSTRNIIINHSIVVTIPGKGAFAICAYRGDNTSSASTTTGGWVQIQPLVRSVS